MKKTETEQIRLANRNQIIDTLRNMGPMARVDIGKLLKLSPATITAITSDLMQEGLLSEIESTPQGVVARGRPRVLIALNPNAVFVIGIKLSMDELRLMLGNMSGEIVAESLVELNTMNLSAEQLINKLIEEIQRFKNDQSKEHLAIHSIGIAVQGVVDAINGHIVWSPAIAQRNISVAEPLSAKFSVPVVLANDANCIAIAIKNQPQYQMLNNYLVVMLGYGVGMGMILNGELYSGHHGAASEFGHRKSVV